ncbi:MAG TPA: glycosyltransferase family 39 protein, partial [bacterium]|nr:glycosyltransferase family 39 protein [bacterium]
MRQYDIKRIYWAVFAGSFFIRSAFLLLQGPDLSSNSSEYTGIARNIVEYKKLAVRDEYTGVLRPYTYRLPGYQLFLAGVYAAFPDSIEDWAAAFFQVLFASFITLITAWIGVRLFSPAAGLLAGSLAAVDPWITFFSAALTNDLFFALISSVVYVLGILALEKKDMKGAVLFGLAVSLACSVRPVMKYFFSVV